MTKSCKEISQFRKAGMLLCGITKHLYRIPGPYSTVKSDRINSLRKQYDSFLDDDKKRKERNEYILGRLDKMRTCTTMAQMRNKPSTYVDAHTARFNQQPVFLPETLGLQSNSQNKLLPVNIPKSLEDSFLLKEIAKNYILIPKRTVSAPTVYDYALDPYDVNTDVKDNTDWKSKYDILDKLKKIEKEEPVNDINSESVVLDTVHENVTINQAQEKYEKPSFEDEHRTILQDVSDNKTGYVLHNNAHVLNDNKENKLDTNKLSQIEYNNEITESLNINAAAAKPDINTGYFNDTQKNESHYFNANLALQPENDSINTNEVLPTDNNPESEYEKANVKKEKTKETGPIMHEQYKPIEDKDKNEASEKMVYPDENDLRLIQAIKPNELVEEITNQTEVPKETENIEYPIEMINTQEFTPHDNVQLQDGVNVNPEGYTLNQSNFDPTYNYAPQLVSEPVENFDATSNNYDPQSATVTDHVGNFDPTYNYDPQTVTGTEDVQQFDPAYNNYDPQAVPALKQAENFDNYDPLPTSEHVENAYNPATDTAGIEAFDAEQREMFYQEQNDANYAYNQEGAGDAYNAEYVQNENYQQNDQYAYYAGDQTEPSYPAEINEHEETSQLYDQSYEEQYNRQQQEGFEQHPQPYADPSHGQNPGYAPNPGEEAYPNEYENSPGIVHTGDHETNEKIERQLDYEQGYEEPQVEGTGEPAPTKEQPVKQVVDKNAS